MRSRSSCPCGSGSTYEACCGPLHAGGAGATTAERLMRSRYAAFVVGDTDYLLRTWHPATRPGSVDPDPGLAWTGLEVLATEGGGPQDTTGVVEFRASYVAGGEARALHEVSRFLRTGGAWLYVRGRTVSE